jgi:glycosyltransferase involved in cell wall biosynthesis
VNIKIANIIEEGRWGGPQKRITMISESLKLYGINTTVILPLIDSKYFLNKLNEGDIPNSTVNLFPARKGLIQFLGYMFFLPRDILNITRILKSENYSLVHISGGAWQIKGVFAAMLADIPVVWHLNDTNTPFFVKSTFKFMARYVDGFILAGKKVEEYYFPEKFHSNFPFKLWQVPAPVDVIRFNKGKGGRVNPVSNLPKPIISTVANVNQVKGFDTLVEVGKILNDTLPEFSIVVAGSIFESQRGFFNSIIDRLSDLGIRDNFHFIGHISDTLPLLINTDVYICTSNYEASPMSVWEAMSAELPIVSTDVGDVSVYLKDRVNGFVLPVGDSNGLAKSILELLSKKSLRRLYGKSARKQATTHLDKEVVAKLTLECYRELLKK